MGEKTPPKEFMFQREYATYKGVSVATVSEAVKKGKVVLQGKKIDVKKTDEIWQVKTANNDARSAEKSSGEEVEEKPNKIHSATLTLQQARGQKEIYQAKIKELEYQEKTGVLISKDLAVKHAEKIAAIIRDRLRNIPQKIAAELAAETDIHAIELKLLEEIDLCLEGIKDLKKLGKKKAG